MEFLEIQKITAIFIILVFFVGRYTWSFIMGKRNKVNVASEIVKGRFLISVIIYAIFPVLILLNIFNVFVLLRIFDNGIIIYVVGLIFSIMGGTFMFLTRLNRRKDWGFMGDKTGESLFTAGVYSITRHPYYVGAIVLGIGVYLILNSWFVLLMIPVILFIKRVIHNEDQYLSEKFGDEFMEYKKKVGVIPWL